MTAEDGDFEFIERQTESGYYNNQRVGSPEQYVFRTGSCCVQMGPVIKVAVETDTPMDPDDISELPADVRRFVEQEIGPIDRDE